MNRDENQRLTDAERKRMSRSKESAEDTAQRRAIDAERKRNLRRLETLEAAKERRAVEADRRRKSLRSETSGQANIRRQADAERQRIRRQHETEQNAAIRRSNNALRQRNQRQQENDDQTTAQRSRASRSFIWQPYDDNTVTAHYGGKMDTECQYCHSLNFATERSPDKTFKYCCHKGTVTVENDNNNAQLFPPVLRDLMSNPENVHYRNFKENIRAYNASLSFASLGANIEQFAGRGPYVFRVHGQPYHLTTHMHPSEGGRQYAQLYVIDSSIANEQRLGNRSNQKLLRAVLEELDVIIREHNVYANLYRTLREVEVEEEALAEQNNQDIPNVSMVFRRDRCNDRRRYNLPVVDEVAMIFRSANGEPPFERDFCVYPRSSEQPNIRLNILSKHLDPMVYVLFYPFGEAGWSPDLEINRENQPQRRRTRVSMLQWKVAQTAVRINKFNPILHGGKLFQQWAVDSYLQVEANNLNFIRHQQGRLRVEQYRGLMDHLNDVESSGDNLIGRPVILPSSFQGSPRNMREKYHDAMAIVAKYGKPDLFVTMTCNPNWREIQENLFPGQQSNERPDLIARVFRIKLKALLKDITDGHRFGRVKAFVYTIEFQKRGLPHAHILLILNENSKIDTPEKVDRYINAEIPDPVLEPLLHNIVTKTMVHGPCGSLNPNAPCMEDGVCTKKYPKTFAANTTLESNSYPIYRRQSGMHVKIGTFEIDNRFIIPYNKFLSKTFECHINVEAVLSVKAIKYIYKYIYKGYDKASVEFRAERTPSNDEISHYLDARYVCAPEAMWRLLENPMHDRSHAVYRLAIHLPEEQLVYFQDGEEELAASRAAARKTHLTAWFQLNIEDNEARQYFYSELPYHYVFDQRSASWKKRQKGGDKIVSRMYSVSPTDRERFHLRILLQHVKGPQRFEDLRTFEGVLYPSFQQAASARGLLSDDTELRLCLAEAATFKMPRQLRQMFALICVFNSPTDPKALYDLHSRAMNEDYIQHFAADVAVNKVLEDIESVLRIHGKRNRDYGLPEPITMLNNEHVYNAEDELQEANRLRTSLNPQQALIFDEIVTAVSSTLATSRFFFIDGPGGSGKTYLYNTLMAFFRGHNKSVAAFATTGIAADLLKGGRTVHSGFKIPISEVETSVSNIKADSAEAAKLREAILIIIDEASMMSCHALRIIDTLLREIMNDVRPFGGKTIILGGDFRQTTNVVPRGSIAEILEVCVKSSPLWQYVKHRSLICNMRTAGQEDFNNWVLKLGDGDLNQRIEGLDSDVIKVPEQFLVDDQIINMVYGTQIILDNDVEIQNVSKKVILTTKNSTATELNKDILKLLPGEQRIYLSIDSIVSDDINDAIDFPIEFLNQQCPSGLPPHQLILKIGAFVMLLRNLNPRRGLLNGTRLVVKALHTNLIDAEIITGSNKGERVFIPRIKLQPSESTIPFKMERRQFPVIPAFAMTINKSQGQSFDKVGIYLPDPVFAHGQLYVAFTRAKNHKNISVYIKEGFSQGKLLGGEETYTKNVVIKEILNK